MPEELRTNLLNPETWKRLFYMALFGIAGYVGLFVIVLIVLAQFLLKLFTGRINQRLRILGQEISAYYQQIIAFLCLSSDEKPYPFSAWSRSEEHEPAPPPRRRTPAPRKVTLEAEE